MSSGHFKPEHIPQLTPCITVLEPEESMSFYELVFGFERIDTPLIRDGLIIFAEMFCLDARIMLQRQGSFSSASQTPNQSGQQQGIGLYLYVPNVVEHYTKANECGAEIVSEPLDTFWGDRIYTAKDLNGYIWTFAEQVEERRDISELDDKQYQEYFAEDEPNDSLSQTQSLDR